MPCGHYRVPVSVAERAEHDDRIDARPSVLGQAQFQGVTRRVSFRGSVLPNANAVKVPIVAGQA